MKKFLSILILTLTISLTAFANGAKDEPKRPADQPVELTQEQLKTAADLGHNIDVFGNPLDEETAKKQKALRDIVMKHKFGWFTSAEDMQFWYQNEDDSYTEFGKNTVEPFKKSGE